jgi:DNA-binding SARP family transcriptional activator
MQLRMLGPVQLQDASGPIYAGGPKERTVLAVLAIHLSDVVSEDTLIDALWPEDPPRTAPRTLQSYISRLRRVLNGSQDLTIEALPGGYRLSAGPIGIDVAVVEQHASEGRAHAGRDDPEQAAASFALALSAWSGRPLGEFADEAWAQPESIRLSELRKTILEERIDADLRCGRHALLVGELEAQCRADPFRERLWAQRMVALYRSGRQAEALAVGRELRRRLADELGVDPSPGLQTLERAILTQDASLETPSRRVGEPATGNVPFPPGLTVSGPAAFVGRTNELAILHECWADTASGGRATVFVGGEPGIGKSRLIGEFARGLHDSGVRVLFGTCEEDLDVAYQPFAEALRPLVAHCEIGVLQEHVRKHGGELGRLVPDVGVRIADLPPPLSAEPEAERFRLFEAVTAILETAATAAPVLLVLDDLQWANRPTLLLLRHLLRQQRAGSLMVVGLYRATETSDVLTDTFADLRRSQDVQRVVLDGLDVDNVIAYVQALAGTELDERGFAFARRLHEETAGSPFFVGEVLRHLLETGAIKRNGERWESTVESFELPASVREVIARRTGRLSAPTREVLTLAAVVGPTFSLSLLERANGVHGDALLDAIEEAVVAGMVRDVVGAPGTYTFAHALVRRALYDEPSVLRRARIHRRVAEALEASDGAVDVAGIAMHYLAAAADGVADKAIAYAARAGEQAIEHVAYEEAVRFYEKALEVAEWANLGSTTTTLDLLIGLAGALWKVGEVLPSREMYGRAATLARDLGDAERFGLAALRNPADLGGFAHAMSTDTDLVALLEEALVQLGDTDTASRARVLARLSVELFYTPYAEDRRSALADRAIAVADRVGDPEVLLYTLHCREWATAGPDVPLEERLVRTDAILRLADELGNIEVAYQARFLRFVSFLEAGDFSNLDREADAGRILAAQLGVPGFVPWIAGYESLRAWIAGRLEEGDRLSMQALEEALQRRADPDLVFAVLGAQPILFRYLRTVGDALSLLEPMAEQFADFRPLQSGLALAYMLDGQRSNAAKYYELVAEHDLADVPREATWLLTLGIMGKVCFYLGDERRASIIYDELAPYADRWIATVVTSLGPVSRVLGILAMLTGRFDDANRHFEDALQRTAAVPAPVFHAETCFNFADLLHRRGRPEDRERARELVAEALRIANELELVTLTQWAQPLADELAS